MRFFPCLNEIINQSKNNIEIFYIIKQNCWTRRMMECLPIKSDNVSHPFNFQQIFSKAYQKIVQKL